MNEPRRLEPEDDRPAAPARERRGGPGQSALRLGAITAAVVLAVAATWLGTREEIAAAEARAERERVAAVLPADRGGAPVQVDRVSLPAHPLLGGDGPRRVYRARRAGELAAIAVQATAPDGYNGTIRLLVGITAEGALSGVRVLAHRETPGLGDGIEAEVSPWIHGFEGRSLGSPPAPRWTVGRPDSAFDAFTGATITPRAVVTAVRHALEWHAGLDWDALARHPGTAFPQDEG